MGVRNYLIEGVSCSGKTSVCRELQRRGYQAFNGDTDLAYQGDPETGEPADGSSPGHHIWPVGRVEALVANQDEQIPSDGIVIDATAPLDHVVDEIVRQSEAAHRQGYAAERPDQRGTGSSDKACRSQFAPMNLIWGQ